MEKSLASALGAPLLIALALSANALVLGLLARRLGDRRWGPARRTLALEARYQRKLRRHRHQADLRAAESWAHLDAVAEALGTADTARAEAYLRGVLAGRRPRDRYCDHPEVDALVAAAVEEARAQGIALTSHVDLPAQMGIEDWELGAFFGNTIENALEACGRIPQDSPLATFKSVGIRAALEQGRLVVRIENTIHETPQTAEGPGLNCVRAIADRYGGSLRWSAEGHRMTFSAVLFPRSEKSS